MTQHAAQYARSHRAASPSVLSAKTPQVRRFAPDSDGKLLEGVAAQDALVALFDEFADEESTELGSLVARPPRGIARLR